MRSEARRTGVRRAPRRQVVDAVESVDVPETDPGPGDLRTETTISAIALLAGRLFKREARALARSYTELRSAPGGVAEVDRWIKQQVAGLAQRRATLVQPLTQRYQQFEAQLTRQIEQQLAVIGVVKPRATNTTIGLAIAARPDPTVVRRAASMIEQSTKLIADTVTRRLQTLLDQTDAIVNQAALHGQIELPAIDFGPKVKTLTGGVQRAAVDVTWTYQTAVQSVQYEAAGVRYAEWRSQRDRRVRPAHKDRDGQVYDLKKGLNGTFPGREVACRCYPIPKRPGYEPR